MSEIETNTVSTREAVKVLGVSRQRLDQLRKEGQLSASKDADGKLRWNAAEIVSRAARKRSKRRST